MDDNEKLLAEADGYSDTLKGVLALVHWMIWDDSKNALYPDVEHLHGSPQIYEDGADPVTPDLALRVSPAVGLLGEAKISFGGSYQKDAIREQLTKYDKVACRWVAQSSVKHCSTVLLTHGSRKTEAADYFAEERTAGRFVPKGKFAVVGFMRSNQRRAFVFLERASGEIEPTDRDAVLRAGVNIRLEYLDERYGSVKFYDAAPPLCYLLEVIWDHALPSLIPEESYTRDARGRTRRVGSRVPVEVEVASLATRLRDAFSMRLLNRQLPESPRVALVRAALGKLVSWELATRSGPDRFLVGWRKLRQGALEYFCSRLAKDAQVEAEKATRAKSRRGSRRRRGRSDGNQMSIL
jgi:hypothetical protein